VAAVSLTLQQIDLIHRLAIKYPNTFGSPTAESASALRAWKDHKKFVSPIGIEGLHQIGNSYSNLRLFSTLGARYATLTHNCHNKFADAALITNSTGSTVKAPPQWNGLSKDGDVIIGEMNRIGMLVDISHVSHKTMMDVLGATPDAHPGSMAPVMFSHSSAYALCPHPRNVPDNVLSLVKKTNSIVMVNLAPDFISCTSSSASSGLPDFYPVNNTLHQVARHIVYIGELIGYDHVGIGADFDGIPAGPEGLEDVSKMPDLFAELLRMGVSDEDAAKIAGKNILRVWGEMEKVAAKMQREGKVLPAEDPVDSPFNPYASS
jgi:membrane dipeptidase